MHFGFSRICVSVTSTVLVDSLFKHLSVNNVYYEAVMVRGVVRWHVCAKCSCSVGCGGITSLSTNRKPGLANAALLLVLTQTHSPSL